MEKHRKRSRFIVWQHRCKCGLQVGRDDQFEPLSIQGIDSSTIKHCEHHLCDAGFDMRFIDGAWKVKSPDTSRPRESVTVTATSTIVICSHCGEETAYPFPMVLSSVYMQTCPECGKKFKPTKEACDE